MTTEDETDILTQAQKWRNERAAQRDLKGTYSPTPEELALFEPVENPVIHDDPIEETRKAVASRQQKPKPFINDPTKPENLQKAYTATAIGNVGSALAGLGNLFAVAHGASNMTIKAPTINTDSYYRQKQDVMNENAKIATYNEALARKNKREQDAAVAKVQTQIEKTKNAGEVNVKPNYKTATVQGHKFTYDANKMTDETVLDLFDKFFDTSGLDYRPTTSEKREILLRYSLGNNNLKEALGKYGVTEEEDFGSMDFLPKPQPLFQSDAKKYISKFKSKYK